MRFFNSNSLVVLYFWTLLLMSAVTADTDPDTSLVPTTTLSNGLKIPLVGLGCASGVRKPQVLSALEAGYRYLDTAQAYQWGYDEASVAEAIQESPHVTRKDVFVTTKVHPENLGYDAMKRAVQTSLALPGFEGYLDAVLIHKPRCWEGACNKEPEGTWQESWVALQELYESGVVRAIGICDVNDPRMLEELLGQRIKPHLIQNWFDPFHQEKKIRSQIQAAGILFQGYSTLGAQWTHFRGLTENPVHHNAELQEIAKAHGAPGPAQVVLNWAVVHKGISVIPASRNPQRQADNLLASFRFQLTNSQVHVLDHMDGHPPKPPIKDPNEVSITFGNPTYSRIHVYWVDAGGEEVELGVIEPSDRKNFKSYNGHIFTFYDEETNGYILRHFVDKELGQEQEVFVGGPTVDEEEL